MKKIITLATFFTCFVLLNKTEAQVRIGVGINFGTPVRVVAPQPYYDDNYYYYPDWDVYYNVGLRQYVYFDGGNWIRCGELPYSYRGYDFAHANRIVINERNPYLRGDYYRSRYGYHAQPVYANRGGYGERYERRDDHDRDDRFRDNRYSYDNRNRGGYENRGGGDNRGRGWEGRRH